MFFVVLCSLCCEKQIFQWPECKKHRSKNNYAINYNKIFEKLGQCQRGIPSFLCPFEQNNLDTNDANTEEIQLLNTELRKAEEDVEQRQIQSGKEDLKESNYASFDCGAVVKSSNREAEHATAILLNAKDSYMLNSCSADKFVEIELCDEIKVHRITLANFEYFSSIFQDFNVYGSSNYPPSWIKIGSFRGILKFLTKLKILGKGNRLKL
jgi:hypothetical protein